MAKNIILYNPLANNKRGFDAANVASQYLFGETDLIDITGIEDIYSYIEGTSAETKLYIAGGDGTINRLVNILNGRTLTHEVYYYAAGSGNDFRADVIGESEDKFILLNPYLTNLPRVTVNGETMYFINGIGYGIDGYCCEVGDKQKAESDRPVNYAGIAIKGLLFHFKPRNATVTVDGVTKTFRKVWLAPSMKGRFYGGGMQVAPRQDRLEKSGLLSVVVMYGSGKLKTLCVFPSIFKGRHVSHREMVEVMTGHEITVKFDSPCALQVDGETILNVTEYTVRA